MFVKKAAWRFNVIKSTMLKQVTCFYQKSVETRDHFPPPETIYTNKLKFYDCLNKWNFPIFQILDTNGQLIDPNQEIGITQEDLVKMMQTMIILNTFDILANELQQKKIISLYATSFGEEGLQIGSAAALAENDMVFTQYREPGVGLWRGFDMEDMLNQLFANKDDINRGKQMPIHYSNKDINFFSISSPLGTQMPQAVGYSYMNKIQKKKQGVICYFGEGTASVGDAFVALNFAATLECPIIFFCRNNGYAISTPTDEQYHGDGLAARGCGFGISTLKVDGNDPLAVYLATKTAREFSIEQNQPVLIEAMTYRVGNHTTDEHGITYRCMDEVKYWELNDNPLLRFQTFLIDRKLWSKEKNKIFHKECRDKINFLIERAQNKSYGNPLVLFEDVYDSMNPILKKQMEKFSKFLALNREHYPGNFENPNPI
uniref:2-oxoisovalerate dehydrogenase subunit alpha n=1 Tax=Schmidtea mediterranea TaxID=79327 RepID=A0A5P8I4K8_SCHMD|nr:BCKHDA-like protein [Schmidtea mediterranea]